MMDRRTGRIGRISMVAIAIAALFASRAAADSPDHALPNIRHVFIIVLENQSFDETFGPASPAAYLATDLVGQGALLKNYYGIGHFSLDNYIAMISGQAPNPATQSDCPVFAGFVGDGTDPDGQAIGKGCVYPADIKTIADQLEAAGLRWKAYMEDMGNDLTRESRTCGRPPVDQPDPTQRAAIGDQYAARHDPFVYFRSITESSACRRAVVNLDALNDDLKAAATTPSYVFITPNLCHDGHDGGRPGKTCVDGEPGGLVSADRFLREWVPRILSSPAFRQDGLLVVTFDEADMGYRTDPKTGAKELHADATACCDEQPGPDIPPGSTVFGMADQGPGVIGPGGGRIGAVLVSRFIRPGTISNEPYNHYSLLRTVETLFGLPYLGYAGRSGLKSFDADIFAPTTGAAD